MTGHWFAGPLYLVISRPGHSPTEQTVVCAKETVLPPNRRAAATAGRLRSGQRTRGGRREVLHINQNNKGWSVKRGRYLAESLNGDG